MEHDATERQVGIESGKTWTSQDKTLLKRSMLSVFFIGLAAHAYGFLNFMIGHDSLTDFYIGHGQNVWKIQLGRVLVPLYHALTKGSLTMPWMTGLIALFWIGLAVFLVLKMFRVESLPLVALTAGFFVTNVTVAAQTASYIYELDVNMFALLLATGAAYLWNRSGRSTWIGMFFVAGSLGFYQSYLSVAITLIMIKCIMDLLEGASFSTVMKKGLCGIGMLAGGAVLYLLLVRAVCMATGVALVENSYNSITQIWKNSPPALLKNLVYTYVYWFGAYLKPVSVLNQPAILLANLILIGFAVAVVLGVIVKKKMKAPEAGLLLVLGLLLPLGMNISCWLSGGVVHRLMTYAFCLAYFLVILLVAYLDDGMERVKGKAWLKRIITALLALVIWSNIGVANGAYMKRELTQQATLSVMTRALDRIEQQEGYIPGETPVALLGTPHKEALTGFEECSRLVGLDGNLQITYYGTYRNYFRYILNEPVELCSEEYCKQLGEREEIRAMPVFPAPGCVRIIDGTVVVKFS